MRTKGVIAATIITTMLIVTVPADAKKKRKKRGARHSLVQRVQLGTSRVFDGSVFGGSYYTDSNGHRVHRPVEAYRRPAGSSAKCRDGTYSFSHSRRGTCSHHGGVAIWY